VQNKFKDFYDKLDEAAQRLEKVTREIGHILLELDKKGGNSYLAMRYLQKKYSFSMSEMKVWMRVAKKELPTTLAEKVPSHKICNMKSSVANELVGQKLKIWSSEENKISYKRLEDLTKKEITDNITKNGLSFPRSIQRTDNIIRLNACDFLVINKGAHSIMYIVTKHNNDEMHIKISPDIKKKLAAVMYMEKINKK